MGSNSYWGLREAELLLTEMQLSLWLMVVLSLLSAPVLLCLFYHLQPQSPANVSPTKQQLSLKDRRLKNQLLRSAANSYFSISRAMAMFPSTTQNVSLSPPNIAQISAPCIHTRVKPYLMFPRAAKHEWSDFVKKRASTRTLLRLHLKPISRWKKKLGSEGLSKILKARLGGIVSCWRVRDMKAKQNQQMEQKWKVIDKEYAEC